MTKASFGFLNQIRFFLLFPFSVTPVNLGGSKREKIMRQYRVSVLELHSLLAMHICDIVSRLQTILCWPKPIGALLGGNMLMIWSPPPAPSITPLLLLMIEIPGKKKSRTRETKHLSTDADSSTDTTVGWTKNTQKRKNHRKRKNSKTSRNMPKLAIRPSTRGL